MMMTEMMMMMKILMMMIMMIMISEVTGRAHKQEYFRQRSLIIWRTMHIK